MNTLAWYIWLGVTVVVQMFVLPFSVYACMKLGTLGILQAKKLFAEKNKNETQ